MGLKRTIVYTAGSQQASLKGDLYEQP
jgi:hypothetical protein